jgi:DNA repair exonuclease SbcCD nuclease subunit
MRLLPLLLLPLHLASAGTFFWATDMHVDIWGELGNPSDEICAWTPSAQLQSAVAAMSSIDAAPDFILCSGDIVHFPNRNSSDLSKDVVLQTHTAFTDYIRASFPSTPLYSALGNHDLHPSNNWPTNVETRPGSTRISLRSGRRSCQRRPSTNYPRQGTMQWTRPPPSGSLR